MGNTTQSIFRVAALASRLITQDQLDRVEAAILQATGSGAPGDVPDAVLASKLVELDVLTSYQADQLREGRSKLNLGPYIITDWIGQGGMGQVFKAVHEMMGRESAVKVLPLNKSTPQAIVNFTREIRTQAQLDHPNLVRAYDAGHDGNVYYLVTEYVPGMDLRRLIRTQAKPLTMQHAANIILQAAQGSITPINAVYCIGTSNRATSWSHPRARPKCRTWAWRASFIWRKRIPGWQNRGHRRLPVARTDPFATRHYAVQRYLLAGLHALLRHYRQGAISRRDHPRQGAAASGGHALASATIQSRHRGRVRRDRCRHDGKGPRRRMQTAAEVCQRLEPWASDSVALPSQPMTKSPWMPPPLPTGRDELDAQDTNEGDEIESSRGSSQWSQATDPLGTTGQDTLRIRAGRGASPPWP